MKICIGIISYLPDSEEKRLFRQIKLLQLIESCNKLFNLPIVIIAQNWKDFEVSSCIVYRYDDPLGIVGARKELRRVFLESDYDYLVMLDDDCVLSGSSEDGHNYIRQIEEHPGMCGIFNITLLKLFAISKEMFSMIDYGNGRVEDGDFFEDILLVNSIKKLYPNKVFAFNHGNLSEVSNNFNDPYSTWFHGQFNKHEIGDKTRAILRNL